MFTAGPLDHHLAGDDEGVHFKPGWLHPELYHSAGSGPAGLTGVQVGPAGHQYIISTYNVHISTCPLFSTCDVQKMTFILYIYWHVDRAGQGWLPL